MVGSGTIIHTCVYNVYTLPPCKQHYSLCGKACHTIRRFLHSHSPVYGCGNIQNVSHNYNNNYDCTCSPRLLLLLLLSLCCCCCVLPPADMVHMACTSQQGSAQKDLQLAAQTLFRIEDLPGITCTYQVLRAPTRYYVHLPGITCTYQVLRAPTRYYVHLPGITCTMHQSPPYTPPTIPSQHFVM